MIRRVVFPVHECLCANVHDMKVSMFVYLKTGKEDGIILL